MRKKLGIICMALGAALLVAALSLFLYNEAENAAAGDAADQVLPEVISAADKGMEGALVLDGREYIGYLTIPALGLELPVMSQWSYANLRIAPCLYFGSAESGNLVICGHNYARHFGTLKNLQAGDVVYFTSTSGTSYSYKVARVETLQPNQVADMLESSYDLTLYTCTYGGQSRVTVRCNRV